MKNFAVLVSSIILSILTYSETNAQIHLQETIITPPKFQAGKVFANGQALGSIDEFLFIHVQYHQDSEHHLMIGTEVISFEVNSWGEIGAFQVINSLSPEVDAALIRVLETTSGKWSPGLINDEPVPMIREISVVFKPSDQYDMLAVAKKYQEKANVRMFVKKNPKSALKWYNQAIRLLPNEESLLAARSLCRYNLGDIQGALQDIERNMAFHPHSDSDKETGFMKELYALQRTK